MTRLLLDANVSPALAEALRWQGHDAAHVNDLGLRNAPDETIFLHAADHRFAVVTHDDDYLRLLRSGARRPSVIHLSQRELQRDPVVGRLAQALRLGVVLHELRDRIPQGVAVRVGARGMRVDALPLRVREAALHPPALRRRETGRSWELPGPGRGRELPGPGRGR